MIARLWHGVVPIDKADAYDRYLADSDRGVIDYQRVPGNRGVCLLRRVEGDRAHFLLLSLWDSRKAIEGYTGPDIERARYFSYDRECLIDPEPTVAHYEVLVAPETGTDPAPRPRSKRRAARPRTGRRAGATRHKPGRPSKVLR